MVNGYVSALLQELELVADDLDPATIFFGGGTPSILNLRQWEKILSSIRSFGLAKPDEWTVECNPATLSKDKAKLLYEAGVTRISMGVQSMDADLLNQLGRVHSREMVFKSYDILRSAGFKRVNLDLMFAIPGQTMAVWNKTLQEIIAMAPDHLSCYEVIYEQDTPLYERMKANEFDVNEDLACDMFEALVDCSSKNEFHQYEVANFARHYDSGDFDIPSEACLHNVNYWRGGDFHGLGPSATSYVGGRRTTNVRSTSQYCDALKAGERQFDEEEELAPLKRAGETAAFGLRMNKGWFFDEFIAATGFDLREQWGEAMANLVKRGLGVIETNAFRLNSRGLRFADSSGAEFLK